MEEVDLQYRKDDSCEGTLAIYLNYLRMGYCIGSTVPDGIFPLFSFSIISKREKKTNQQYIIEIYSLGYIFIAR